MLFLYNFNRLQYLFAAAYLELFWLGNNQLRRQKNNFFVLSKDESFLVVKRKIPITKYVVGSCFVFFILTEPNVKNTISPSLVTSCAQCYKTFQRHILCLQRHILCLWTNSNVIKIFLSLQQHKVCWQKKPML